MKSWDDPQCATLPDLPTRASLAAQLQASLAALLTAEQAVLAATLPLLEAKRLVLLREDALLLQDPSPIDGKNAETRAAQVRSMTWVERADVEAGEVERLRAVSALEGARATFAAAKALARLLAGNGE